MLIGSRIAVVLALVCAVGGLACSSDNSSAGPQTADESTYGQTETSPAKQSDAMPTSPTDTAQTTPTTAAPTTPAPAPMTDEQIFAVLEAANAKEIDESNAAIQKTKNKDVKTFAQMMVKHHTEAKNKGSQLAKKLTITPAADFDKAKELKDDTTKQVEQLKSAQATDVDRAYIELMIADHKKVLEMIDSKLMTDAKAAELKTHLQEVRPVVEKHLKDAEALQTKLASAPAAGGKAPAGTPGATPGGSPAPTPGKGKGSTP